MHQTDAVEQSSLKSGLGQGLRVFVA